jgi:pyruvate/2-oxoglutarate dehydrogenase complex dihydrolipoamide dehydrogenase (E3) component
VARHTHDVVIIGAGSGGLTTAYGCAQLGMKTALVEKERLGGDCLHYGCVPSKTLLRAASVYATARNTARFGLPSLLVPPVDIAEVNQRITDVIAHIQVHDSPERYRSLGAEVLIGRAEFLSPHEVRVENSGIVSAKRIVVATGSSPRYLPLPGLSETGYITNLDVFSLSSLPASLAVIGGGPIGVELSQAFARLGSNVTLLEAAPHLLPMEDRDMADTVAERLRQDGVAVRAGINVARVEKAGGLKRVILSGSAGDESLKADEILLAVGRRGNTDDLGLDAAGVEIADSFIVADSRLRTSQKHILAVGDVNGRFLFTHVAGAEGSVAVRRIALHAGGAMNYHLVPWCTYSDPELASIGYNEKRAQEAGIAYSTIVQEFGAIDRALTDGETDGRIKIVLDNGGRMIGAQIVGARAGDLLAPALFGVGSRWKASTLMDPIYPYPTLSELHRKTVSSHMAPRLFNDRVRSVLRLLFRYRGNAGHGEQEE